MRCSDTGLCHGTSGSPQENLESLEYGAKVREIEENLRKNFGPSEYAKEDLSRLTDTEHFTEGAIKHIFEGEVNHRDKAVGYHYEGIKNTDAKAVLGTRTLPDENGVYEANVSVNGIIKRGMSSFFPREWTPQQVVDGINAAYANKSYISGNKYRGKFNRITIEMYLSLEGKIKSAYPLKENS